MAELLQIILPNMLSDEWKLGYNVFIRKHQGKSDLQKSIPMKLKTFSQWNEPVGFIILHDQDSNNCVDLKRKLQELCKPYEKLPVLIRIVCRELEAWYLGDMNAIQQAYPAFKAKTFQGKSKFRNPDMCNAKNELKKILPSYQETSSTRLIAPYLDYQVNKSESFHQFLLGIQSFIHKMSASVR